MNDSRRSFSRLNDHLLQINEAERRKRILLIWSISAFVFLCMLLTFFISFKRSSHKTEDQNKLSIHSSEQGNSTLTIDDAQDSITYSERVDETSSGNSYLPLQDEDPFDNTPSSDTLFPETPQLEPYIDPSTLERETPAPIHSPDTYHLPEKRSIHELQMDQILPEIFSKNEFMGLDSISINEDSLNTILSPLHGIQRGRKIDTIVSQVDVLPLFPGGRVALSQYIRENIIYPEEAIQQQIEGTVFVRFIVEVDGSISNPIIIKSLGQEFDNEAIKLIMNMPPWQPGRKQGQLVPAYRELGIIFKLF